MERDGTLDVRGATPFEPDTLLPSQYFDRVRRRTGRDGERLLMIAVLEDAVHTYLKTAHAEDPERRALFAETAAWFADRDASWFYSFENVCAVLDLNAEYLRRGLRERTRPAATTVEAEAEDAAVDFRRASNG
jgi:hypothetical protein